MTDSRPSKIARTLGVLGAVLIPLAPIAATALLIALRLVDTGRALGRGSRSLVLVWLPSILLALALHGRGAWRLDAFTGPMILILVGLFLPKLRPGQVTGLWLGGLLVVGLLLTERYVAATTWHPATQTAAVSLDRYRAVRSPQEVVGGERPSWVERRWGDLTGATDLTLELELRHTNGSMGRAWFPSDPRFVLEPLPDRPSSTRVVPPQQGEPYVTRRVMTESPLARRTFRATVELRASEALAFTDADCLGVLLREVGGSGTAACFAQEISSSWETKTFEWTVPENASSRTLRVELRVPAAWYEVGATVLEEATPSGWVSLGPLEPTGVRVAFAPPGTAPLEWVGPTFLPSGERTHVSVPVPPEAVKAEGELRVLLRTEPGTTVELASTRLERAGRSTGRPIALPQRGQLWFDHPNLAAHGIVAGNIVVASLSGSPLAVAAAAGVGMVGASLAGSRTAFLALVVTCALLVFVTFGRRRRGGLTLMAGTLVAALAVLAATVGPLAPRLDLVSAGDGNQVGRAEIWAFAVGEMLADPWGAESDSFERTWESAHPGDPRPAPTHAHDLWLHYAVAYGLPGLLVALAFTFGTLVLAGPKRRPAIAIGVFGLFALQITDTTLFYFPVSLSLMLLLASARSVAVEHGRPPMTTKQGITSTP